jgi:hypothetical protein
MIQQYTVTNSQGPEYYIWSFQTPNQSEMEWCEKQSKITKRTNEGLPLVILNNIEIRDEKLPW